MNNLIQDELQLEVWQTKINPNLLCSHRGLSNLPSLSDHKSFLRSKRLFPWGTQSGDTWKWCAQIRLLIFELSEPSGFSGFPQHPWCSVATGFQVLMTDFSCRFRDFWSLPVATSFPLLMNSWASLCQLWELDAASELEFWFALASGLPDNPTCRLEVLSVPGLLDAIGLSTDEELVETDLVRFITIGLDLATILFSSHCSCILFGNAAKQTERFLALRRELQWLMLNEQRRLFHSSRVTCVWCQCTVSESWGPSSFGQILNQEQLCGFWTHVSLLDFGIWWSFQSRLRYPQRCTASHQIEKTSRSTAHSQHCSVQNCRAGLEAWLGFGQKMIPFITCEISLGQRVCKLVFAVDILDLNSGVQINSVKQPKETLWLLDTCLIVGLLPWLSFWSLLHCLRTRAASRWTENLTIGRTLSMWNNSELLCLVGTLAWLFFRVLDMTRCHKFPCADESLVLLD